MHLSRRAKEVGAAYGLSVVPYYNRPTQEGLYLHFKTIAESSGLPTILYNVPGRTVADLANDTVLRLAELPGIVGLKDATGNLERAADLIKRVPADFGLYSGDDASSLAFLLLGGHGVISVTANVAPHAMSSCVAKPRRGISRPHGKSMTSCKTCTKKTCSSKPTRSLSNGPARDGHIGTGIRLPLTALSEGAQPVVRRALQAAGLL